MAANSPTERLILQCLAPLRTLLESESVTEVLVNRHDSIFFEEAGKLLPAQASFPSPRELDVLLNLLAQNAGLVIHPTDFELDTAIVGPPPLRIHANFGASSAKGVCLTLRRIAQRKMTLDELVHRHQSLTLAACEFLRLAVCRRRNVLISGGTGSGKTTLLRCIGDHIPPEERVVLIEDTAELDFRQPDVVSLLTRSRDAFGEGEVTMRDLFRSSLRLRPDRIIIGEVRGPEAFDLVQALSSGHAGSLCTIHADSPQLALTRLEGLAMASGVPTPAAVLRSQISQVIHYVLQISRQPDGSRKVIRIDRLEESRGDQWLLQPVFGAPPRGATAASHLVWSGEPEPWLESLPPGVLAAEAPELAAALGPSASPRGNRT